MPGIASSATPIEPGDDQPNEKEVSVGDSRGQQVSCVLTRFRMTFFMTIFRGFDHGRDAATDDA